MLHLIWQIRTIKNQQKLNAEEKKVDGWMDG
jgi:hypothetical protein